MKGIRWALRALSALMVLLAIALAVGGFGKILAVDLLELIASLFVAAIGCGMLATRLSPVTSSSMWEKLYKRQFWIGLTGVIALTAILAGHSHWQAIGSRHVDVYDAAEQLIQDIVGLKYKQHIDILYISIQNRPLRSALVTALEARHPGINIYSLDRLTPQQRHQQYAGVGTDIIEIDGFSYPAWRVVQVRFTYLHCWDSQDYFYFDDKWLRMGGSFGTKCFDVIGA